MKYAEKKSNGDTGQKQEDNKAKHLGYSSGEKDKGKMDADKGRESEDRLPHPSGTEGGGEAAEKRGGKDKGGSVRGRGGGWEGRLFICTSYEKLQRLQVSLTERRARVL